MRPDRNRDYLELSEKCLDLEKKLGKAKNDAQEAKNDLIDRDMYIHQLKVELQRCGQQIYTKDEQLIEATQELTELSAGIKDFQEETQTIQTELIASIKNLKDQSMA